MIERKLVYWTKSGRLDNSLSWFKIRILPGRCPGSGGPSGLHVCIRAERHPAPETGQTVRTGQTGQTGQDEEDRESQPEDQQQPDEVKKKKNVAIIFRDLLNLSCL